MSTLTTTEPSDSRVLSAAWWLRSADGRLTLWHFPNPALWVWIVAVVIGLFPLASDRASQVDGIRHGALLVWALDELVRGASPFRRVLGGVVLAGQVTMLVIS